jgi:very-short-patch-repair endonuclease
VCLEAKLIVELDGGQHAEQEEHDEKRSQSLEKYGFEVLRFWNCNVFENMDGVLIAIADVLAGKGLCVSPHPTPLPEGEGGREEGDGVG